MPIYSFTQFNHKSSLKKMKPRTKTTHSKTPNPQQWRQKSPKFLLPILISALKNPQNPSSTPLLKSCSTKLLHILQQQQQSSYSSSSFLQTHLNTVIASIPAMMFQGEITCTVVKIVGLLSLFSIEVNQMIADDGVILKGFVLMIVGCEKRVLKTGLINVLLDVCVTCLGRRRLIEVSGLDYVMLGFLQVKKSTAFSNSITIMEKEGNLCLGAELSQDKLPLLLLNVAVTLTNFCNTEQLKKIPRRLLKTLIPYWKEIWSNVRNQLLASEVLNRSKDNCCCLSNITVHNLAEKKSGFVNFLSEHWESSPFLMRKRTKDVDSADDIFSSFMYSVTSEESMPEFLVSLLQGMVSCPRVALDEIDGLNFLDDVRDTLGCPLIYPQDIRVVKANSVSKTENHYFQDKGMEDSRPFSSDDILKCAVAYNEGYTIAIRGMENRLKSIAAITQLVANLFGQPSVGANLYITPPESQGLACHYDDHCVFVCQLRGSKKWNVFPQPVVQLPRLYEKLKVPQEFLVESKQILLKEGDVLYIPRGFAHEARTDSDLSSSENSQSSAHLTLAIDVVPPFEWEAFAHVALHGWSHGKQTDDFTSDTCGISEHIYVNVLHVAIRLISHTEPVFRKACLVAATSLPPETKDWLDDNQRAVFNQVLNKVHELANFTDSVNFVKTAIQQNEDPFQWLRWLEHLNEKGVDFDSAEISKILLSIDEDKAKAEAAFCRMKSKFCNEALFDNAKSRFKRLHDMYKEGRVQFMNGMLSLHY
ncbi:hypothetical protein RND81_08G019300 [Saponaria officinalis]|uniref:Bifunctional lysine-specific demethylase and histidyl-hydroxylase n=2 Tax=Saponaria officinalis TaxID=3572 RepID=A0AAW1J332_SAPOF